MADSAGWIGGDSGWVRESDGYLVSVYPFGSGWAYWINRHRGGNLVRCGQLDTAEEAMRAGDADHARIIADAPSPDEPTPRGATYADRGRAIGAMVDRKQREYGDSYHRAEGVIRALWPDGIPVESYMDALAVVRVIDKLFRIAAGKQGDEDPWKDIAGYGLLGME